MEPEFSRWFLNPFIAKREMPGTNGEEENTKIYSIYRCYKHLVGDIYISYEL
jgi:hypothetical protein